MPRFLGLKMGQLGLLGSFIMQIRNVCFCKDFTIHALCVSDSLLLPSDRQAKSKCTPWHRPRRGRTLVSIKALSAAGSGTNHPTIVCTTEGRNNAHSSSSFALVVLPRIIILFDLLSPIVEIVLFVVVVPAQIIQVSGNGWKGRA